MSASATLSPPAAAPSPAVRVAPGWGVRVDVLTVGLALLFAFESASFVARNPDLWRHLAAGRLIAHGAYSFGVDPFAFSTAGRYWANHSWLFDLGAYLCRQSLGEPVLAAIKALLAGATAGLMLIASRGRGPTWIATLCVIMGLLAMSRHLLLQPVVASYFLLAACLVCLRAGGKRLRIVPLAIVVWVNLDGWFLLGPALVGLFWLGRKFQGNQGDVDTGTYSPPWPGWLFPASVAAGLVSPHHVRAFVLPSEVSPAVWFSSFASDPRLADRFFSPWHLETLGSAGGYDLSAAAFFALLGLGVISFACNRTALRSWRGTVWLAFATLAAWQARLVPFFAVVGAPICALNLRETMLQTSCIRLGRTIAAGLSLVLVGLGYFGWQNGFHTRDRGIAWAIQAEPTLERAATGLARWRQDTGLADAAVFTSHPDFGDALPWFAEGERCYIDSRLSLFTPIADDFEALSRAAGLIPETPVSPRSPLADSFPPRGVTAIALYDPAPDFHRMSQALKVLTRQEASGWDIVRVDGRALLLAPKGTTAAANRIEPERLAFSLQETDIPHAGNGPAVLAEIGPWQAFERPLGRKGSWEADEAEVFTDPSTAVPILAVRLARVGIEKDSRDDVAWLALARAYQPRGTARPSLAAALTPLSAIRHLQTTTALVQAVLRNPDATAAHELLADEFARGQTLDLALVHANACLRLLRRDGPSLDEDPASFNERLASLADRGERLEAAVQDAENRFFIRTATLAGEPLARARIADELGLRQRAIDVLLASHPDLYGVDGLKLLADLLLRTGKVVEARTLLDRAELRARPATLGYYAMPGKPHPGGHAWTYQFPAYDWFDLCTCAAEGRYDNARAAIDRIAEQLDWQERTVSPPFMKSLAGHLTSEAGMGTAPLFARLLSIRDRAMILDQIMHIRFLTVARADVLTLGAVLELERGRPAQALGLGERALALYESRRGAAPALPGEPLAKRYVEAMRRKR